MSDEAMNIDDQWIAALADAGIEPAAALLFAFPGEHSPTGDLGKTWLRGSLIDDPGDIEAFGDRLTEANGEEGLDKYRVAIWTARTREGVAGAMRHELEHSLQFDVHGGVLQQLHSRAVEVLSEYAGGLSGSAVLYNKIPMEADANAAAARFVRAQFGDAAVDELIASGDDDVALFRSTETPGSIASLHVRMKTFIEVEGPPLAREFASEARRWR